MDVHVKTTFKTWAAWLETIGAERDAKEKMRDLKRFMDFDINPHKGQFKEELIKHSFDVIVRLESSEMLDFVYRTVFIKNMDFFKYMVNKYDGQFNEVLILRFANKIQDDMINKSREKVLWKELIKVFKRCSKERARALIITCEKEQLIRPSIRKEIQRHILGIFKKEFKYAAESRVMDVLFDLQPYATKEEVSKLMRKRIELLLSKDEIFSTRYAMTLAMCGFKEHAPTSIANPHVFFMIFRYFFKQLPFYRREDPQIPPGSFEIAKIELAIRLIHNFTPLRRQEHAALINYWRYYRHQLQTFVYVLENSILTAYQEDRSRDAVTIERILFGVRGILNRKITAMDKPSFGIVYEVVSREKAIRFLQLSRTGNFMYTFD